MSWTLLLYIWGSFDVLMLIILTQQLFFSNKYLNKDKSSLKKQWLPFVRTDRPKWNNFQMYFCTIFLMFWRTLIFLICAFTLQISLRLLFLQRSDPNIPLPKWKIFLRDSILTSITRIILFVAGFHYIPLHKKKISDFDANYPAKRDPSQQIEKGSPLQQKTAPISISNHITLIDTIYYVYLKKWSFLSKKEVMSLPFFGISTISLQCLYVSREDSKDRNSSLDKMNERITQLSEGENLPPLFIFPEGTVSNGDYLINFQNGAFRSMSPIQIMCLQYGKRSFNPYLCQFPIYQVCFFLMTQYYNQLISYEFDNIYPELIPVYSGFKIDCDAYSEYCQHIMAKCLKVEESDAGYRHNLEYVKQLFDQNIDVTNNSSNVITQDSSKNRDNVQKRE